MVNLMVTKALHQGAKVTGTGMLKDKACGLLETAFPREPWKSQHQTAALVGAVILPGVHSFCKNRQPKCLKRFTEIIL